MFILKSATRSVLIGLFVVLCSLFSLTATAEPLSTGWLTNPNHTPVETRFVLTGQINEEDKTVAGFLEVRLAGDWKTYWRSPGEGGVAPSMTFDKSENLNDISWHWPHPKRFEILGVETLGYVGSVVFPMTLHVNDINKPVVFNADLTMSSCTTVCVLTDYQLGMTFTPSNLMLNEEAMHVHAQGLSQVPKPSPLITDLSAVWDQGQSKLQVTVNKSVGWTTPDVLIDGTTEALEDASFTRPVLEVEGNQLVATFEVTSWMGTPEIGGEEIIVTLHDDNFVAEETTVTTSDFVGGSSGDFSIAQMFLFALFGGLILNIMPCVLPVLGMKLSSAVSAHGLEKKQIRFQFLASAGGILFSFWLIAGLLTVLKLSGSAIGWGIQFQSAWFIGLMILITALFGANMLSLFEIKLSSNANTWLAQKGDNSYAGHFTQGMFATLLATPCSAPFLGTAVAFALATNITTMFAIFTALALGMALPWILVAMFPSIALALPKPGAWMNKVKYVFGAMMIVTSVWLLSLLTNHFSVEVVYGIGVLSYTALVARIMQVHGHKAAAFTGASIVLLMSAVFYLGSSTSNGPLPEEPDWVAFSTEAIQEHVDNGKVVFVNVTADWCITCKANKIGVMLQDPVYSELTSGDVVPMEADWTVPSDDVTSYLQSNGQFGVPFNKVYGPNAPEGIVLPIILLGDVVLEAIEKAGGK
ncbi:protein-disulfide reductase DsbD family protein [Vibrio chagasii]|uniref:protein-disulfide reductase DsbD family protein n=1 Tax=Vibrio chagasii TaxID=170679 RepID=UPI003DAA18EE